MEYHEHEDQSERPALTEKNLGACLALKSQLTNAVRDNAGFKCSYPDGPDTPEPVVHGDPMPAIREALLDFKVCYNVDEEVWNWMLLIVDASVESDEWIAERDVRDGYASWRTAAWVRTKLQAIHLGWLMGKDDNGHRETIARAVIEREAARIIREVLQEWLGDEEEFVYS